MSRTLAFTLAIAAATSCGPEREPETSGVALEDAAELFGEAFCEPRAECCSPFEVPSVAECESTMEQTVTAVRDVAEAEELTYDPSCWAATVEHLRERGCEADPAPDEAECRAPCWPFHGGQQLGEYCTVYEVNVTDCAQGLECAPPFCEGGNCKEVCRDPCARSELGERCLDVPCERGLSCDVLLDECVPTPEIGEPCVWGSGCGEGAMCDDATDECVPGVEPDELGAPGTPCNSYLQCESGSCPAGYCAEHPERGEPCTGRCADGLECSATTSTCVDPSPSICTDDPL